MTVVRITHVPLRATDGSEVTYFLFTYSIIEVEEKHWPFVYFCNKANVN